MASDPSYPEIDIRDFHLEDWADLYGGNKETIPDNEPEPRGKPVILGAFVDSDHANDKVRCRSDTGFCFFINIACIIWYTKRQATVESAVSGAEFVGMKQDIGVSQGLQYKLRIMGVLIGTHPYVWR